MGKNAERLEHTVRSLRKPECTWDRNRAPRRDTRDKLITKGVALWITPPVNLERISEGHADVPL